MSPSITQSKRRICVCSINGILNIHLVFQKLIGILIVNLNTKMEFPDDVVAIISAYSKPVTRPDWKTYIVMSEKRFHAEFEKQLCKKYSSRFRLLNYKPIFGNNHYKDFKYKYCDYIIEL